MEKISKYQSKPTATDGRVYYSDAEENTWKFLIERQNRAIQGRACQEFVDGVKKLNFSDKIPQYFEVNDILIPCTGWGVEPVPAIIPAEDFFKLLSKNVFHLLTLYVLQKKLIICKSLIFFMKYMGTVHC